MNSLGFEDIWQYMWNHRKLSKWNEGAHWKVEGVNWRGKSLSSVSKATLPAKKPDRSNHGSISLILASSKALLCKGLFLKPSIAHNALSLYSLIILWSKDAVKLNMLAKVKKKKVAKNYWTRSYTKIQNLSLRKCLTAFQALPQSLVNIYFNCSLKGKNITRSKTFQCGGRSSRAPWRERGWPCAIPVPSPSPHQVS